MAAYWPFWAGAAALGGLTVGYWTVLGRSLGVSGAWQRLTAPRAAKEPEVDAAALEAALLAATLAAFPGAAEELKAEELKAEAAGTAARKDDPPRREPMRGLGAKPGLAGDVAFLGCLLLGAFLAASLSGRFAVERAIPADFSVFFGTGAGGFAALFGGGLLVGFGATMAGGCTSGHGLTGCGALRPASLLATATFFGAGVAVSFALDRWLR